MRALHDRAISGIICAAVVLVIDDYNPLLNRVIILLKEPNALSPRRQCQLVHCRNREVGSESVRVTDFNLFLSDSSDM